MTKTRIALIQMKMSSEQTNNMDTAIRKIKDAVRKKAKVIFFPNFCIIYSQTWLYEQLR